MAQGFLAGLLWGGVAGAGLLVVSTQVIERQDVGGGGDAVAGPPEASAVEVPVGTEFDQARQASDPQIPTEETRPGGEAVSDVAPPADLGTTPPAFDTSALEVPQPVTAPEGLGEVPTPAEEVTLGVTGPGESAPQIAPLGPLATPQDSAAAPETDTGAPELAAPDDADADAPELDSSIEAPVAADDAPAQTEEPSAPSPETVIDAPATPSSPEAPAQIAAPSVPQTSQAPVISAESAPSPVVDAAPSLPEMDQLASAEIDAPEAPTQPEAPSIEGSDNTDAAPEADSEAASEPEGEATTEPEMPVTPDATEESVAPEVFERDDAAEPQAELVETPQPEETIAEPTPEPEPEPEPEAQPEPEVEAAPVAPRIRPSPGAEGGLPRVIRLIGDDAPVAAPQADEVVEEAEPIDPNAGALERFRVTVDISASDAILSVVILHEGPLPDAAMISDLPRGLTFAVDAGAADAEAIAAAYRSAGREVVLIPDLPERARPQDVEQAMQANLRTVPQAVAVMDTTGGGFQSDREAVAQVVDAIGSTGHGLITFPRGLNTAHQRAEREGVPRGLIFRDIDAKGESAEEIGRSLDRAAFRARQSRQPVILVGRSTDGTLGAVSAWQAQNSGDGVVLAPVSAALLAGN